MGLLLARVLTERGAYDFKIVTRYMSCNRLFFLPFNHHPPCCLECSVDKGVQIFVRATARSAIFGRRYVPCDARHGICNSRFQYISL